MSRATSSLVHRLGSVTLRGVFAAALAVAASGPALAKTPAHCRIITFDGAAGAASFDKVTFRAVDAVGAELDRSCLIQVQTSETAQHFSQRLPGDWGDGQCVVPLPTPTPPAAPLNNTCGTGVTGASCRHKYKLKKGALTVRVCCYEGAGCSGNKVGKTNPSRLPITVQQKKDPELVFGPTPVPIAVGSSQVALDPIGMTQQPFREAQGCRDALSKELAKHALAVLHTLTRCHKLQMAGDLTADCNSVNPGSDADGVIAGSMLRVGGVASEKCAPGGTPARLGYQRLCPAPCADVNRCTAGNVAAPCATDADCDTSPGNGRCGPGEDWNQAVQCTTCLIERTVSGAIGDKYGAAGPGMSLEAQKCQDTIGNMLAYLVRTFDKVTLDCQKNVDGGKLGIAFCQLGQCTGPPSRVGQSCVVDDDCIDPTVRLCKYADMNSARTFSAAKAAAKLTEACSPGSIAELDTCGIDPPSLNACVKANAHAVADALADAKYPEGVGHTPCDSPGPACPTGGGTPTPSVTPTPGPLCGNGVPDPGEDCDPPGSACPNAGPEFVCSPTCECACPGTLSLTPLSGGETLDLGWSGMQHDESLSSDGTVSVAVSGCAGSSRPCGVCNLTGPVGNPLADAGQIHNRRCTGNTRQKCTTTADCVGVGGTCEYYFGTALPLNAGGLSFCIVNQVQGPVTGTANIETGSTAAVLDLALGVHIPISTARPCARCVGDAVANDGVRGGICDAGPSAGLACDVNGTAPNAWFGATSLDCLPSSLLGSMPVKLDPTTGVRSKILNAANPNCRAVGFTGLKCFCDTCNNGAVTPCNTNADCPDPPGPIGGICGGKRCLGGANDGAACTVASECPSGGSCAVPGSATAPNACDDATCSPTVGNEGECSGGPTDLFCMPNATMVGCISQADCNAAGLGTCVSGANAGSPCTASSECPGGSCVIDTCTGSKTRECYTDNGAVGATISATGAVDPPVGDQSTPTLATLFCIGANQSVAVNAGWGAPGLGRLEVPVHVRARP